MAKMRNMWSLLSSNDKNDFKPCVVYKEDCPCSSRYIAEFKRDAEARWSEYDNLTKNSEPSQQLRNNSDHCLPWNVISGVPRIVSIF